jgi:hypothetical protein
LALVGVREQEFQIVGSIVESLLDVRVHARGQVVDVGDQVVGLIGGYQAAPHFDIRLDLVDLGREDGGLLGGQ